ncbi:uncharacterized protein LOC123294077 [Chrysoperla carnea]|uniref:uncharacterized protein LOC123294077 n=1 Tax=Chrysoperla carnea TaxID=189513 RepID=UPI001D098253|nr:uncharacterized protein LOC123294077 [Chrysoperla carnea]
MGRPFTTRERELIIKYIVRHREYQRLTSANLWKEMNIQLNLNRTWESLRGHYKHVLAHNLEAFEFLTPEQIQSFKYKRYIAPTPRAVPKPLSSTAVSSSRTSDERIKQIQQKREVIEATVCLRCKQNKLVAINENEGNCIKCNLKHEITFEANEKEIKEIQIK